MKKSYFLNLILLFVSLIVSFILTEVGLRILLFNNIPLLTDISILAKQKDPRYYSDPNSEEDFHRLACRLENDYCGTKNIHPLLGWIGNFSPDDYKHNDHKFINSRRPVLLYGDSFTQGVGNAARFQDILNKDNEFSRDHYLLNYGVRGYGLDQIYLTFHNSIDHYDNPFVVLGFMTEDLDRSSLTFFSGQKPHFKIMNNKLVLERPLIIDPHDFKSQYPPQIHSYVYRRILHSNFIRYLLPEELLSFLRRDGYYEQKKTELNEKIILNIINELRAKKLDFIFLIFHHGGDLTPKDDWRDSFLKNILDKNNVPYIWSKKIISEYNISSGEPLFISDGHPATAYNKIISTEIKRYVLGAGLIGQRGDELTVTSTPSKLLAPLREIKDKKKQ